MFKRVFLFAYLKQCLLLITIAQSISSFSQNKDLELAEVFYSDKEFEKAEQIYSRYILKGSYFEDIYEHYVFSKRSLKEYGDLLKVLKKLAKRDTKSIVFLDLLITYGDLNEKKAKKNAFEDLVDKASKDNYTLLEIENALELRGDYETYQQLLLKLREQSDDDYLYSRQLLDIYRITDQKERYIEETLNILKYSPELRESLQNEFQINFDAVDYTTLEMSLMPLLNGKDPLVYQRMLIWSYIQTQRFSDAFIQQRGIDVKLKHRGKKLLDLSLVAYKNGAHTDAIEILEYICIKYENLPIYVGAKKKLIAIKVDVLTSSYPLDSNKIQKVIDEYEILKFKSPDRQDIAEIEFSQAELYAFYLNDFSTALMLLESISVTSPSRDLRAKAGLLKGDIFLFKDQIGEASLQYFKVEKSWPNTVFAENAKFSNAKLYYYTGEIALSESMLNILKRATSRNISNDAISLSVKIKANSGLDTSYTAIKIFAYAELLSYQRKYKEALAQYDLFLNDFKYHELEDEALMEKAAIYSILSEENNRILCLKKIESSYSDGILADDAVYQLAVIYENSGNREQAMTYYKKILTDFKGSTYLFKSRIAYRTLRGDKI